MNTHQEGLTLDLCQKYLWKGAITLYFHGEPEGLAR